ncbi:hypothetical protein HII36_23145 [Nonomuraea sp. NN258]|uniref:hypothetical protein n=1 Tax=Nonomuraea antri TaxID=2730852 RepID=UPI00156A1617|nr:hypothetical protein [Nonomuraea antri]NRQ34706.1 hypothetical protein [Nonomuraea antri]
MPALIISMNALKLGEQQRADVLKISAQQQAEGQQLRAAADLAGQRAFAQRVTVTPQFGGELATALIFGEPIVVSNRNSTWTGVEIDLTIEWLPAESEPGATLHQQDRMSPRRLWDF